MVKIIGGPRDGSTVLITETENHVTIADPLKLQLAEAWRLIGSPLEARQTLYTRRMIVAGNETVEYLSPATMTDMETLAYMIEKHK